MTNSTGQGNTGIPEAFIYEAVRTPRGKGKPGGSLHTVKPVDLLSGLITEILERNPDLAPEAIGDIITGVVSPLGDQGMDIARTAALNAGLPFSATGVQLNRYCASGLTALNIGAMKVRSGWEDLVLAGGVESMSRVPMGSDGGALALDPETSFYTDFVPQGVSADLIATLDGVTREDLDAYAARSHQRAALAWDEGRFDNSVVPVKDINGLTVLDRDETIRPGTTVEKLAGLRPAFAMVGEQGGFDAVAQTKYPQVEKINHLHHGGNSSGIVDGASLILVGSENAGGKYGLTPRARVVAAATTGVEPTIMLTAPAPAARAALDKAGLTPEDIDVWEINEAFSSVVLRAQRELNIPDEKLNINGGAIAMGHPLGATGAMITGTAVDELHRSGGRYALITLCVAAGMGVATIIERV
jgi:acetyl-CoA C-acetyltransferase